MNPVVYHGHKAKNQSILISIGHSLNIISKVLDGMFNFIQLSYVLIQEIWKRGLNFQGGVCFVDFT